MPFTSVLESCRSPALAADSIKDWITIINSLCPTWLRSNLYGQLLKSSGQEIDQALRNVTRQYLVGDLQKPQALQHVPNSLIEIGITRYENEGKLEPPHRHKQAFEFQYMTAGLTAYLDLTTAEEHVFRKGDFYVIEPGVVYAQKSAPGTEILFIGFRRIIDGLRDKGSA